MKPAVLDRVRRQRAWAKATSGRSPPRRSRPPRQRQPDALRTSYYGQLRDRVVTVAVGLVRAQVLPRLRGLVEEAARERGDSAERADAVGRRARDLMARVRREVEQRIPDQLLERMVQGVGSRVAGFQREQLARQFVATAGVDPLEFEPKLRERIEQFTDENVALIKSLPAEYLEGVEKRLLAGLRAGTRAEDLAEQLRAREGVAESRAALIARDQVGKFYAELNSVRQRDLGVESYIWRTMNDNRVREEHAEREGQTFAWTDPPADGHPGQAVQCRCYAEPVLAPLLEKL